MSAMLRSPQRTLLSVLLSRLTKSRPPAPKKAAPMRPFQAISIFRGTRACEMARKFSEHRFLAREAPQLPLTGCSMSENCECRYIRHRDRRGESRRVLDFFKTAARSVGYKERRLRRGRRSDD
jgi:hypothetical protein